jgi:formiminoglutamase
MSLPDFLNVRRGNAPLLVSLPHTGTDIPADLGGLVSDWLTRRDADWWIDRLYGFATDLDATILRTSITRTAIDVNRDPSGASLYPGQATTELCPTTTFDGDPLYLPGAEPDADEIARRRNAYFDPYHAALAAEISRLREKHPVIVLYDCHSIRSVIPRLFDGELPVFNIGTNRGASCDPVLEAEVNRICLGSGRSTILNGRFTGGWITRRYGKPGEGVHAVQMELACRAYMVEPDPISPANWPTLYDPDFAKPLRADLERVLRACLDFAAEQARP